MMQLKSMLWAWVENMLREEPGRDTYINPETLEVDQHQNSIMNIYFGVDNYWKMDIFLDIAADLKQKKFLMKEEKINGKDNKDKLAKIQEKSKNKLDDLIGLQKDNSKA